MIFYANTANHRAMSIIKERQNEILDEFAEMPDWRERYFYIIDLGNELDAYPETCLNDAHKVSGCVSQVWMCAEKTDAGTVKFFATSDSVFVKGLIALLLWVYSEAKPAEILDASPEFFRELGVIKNLSPNRANGLASMIHKIYEFAKKYQ